MAVIEGFPCLKTMYLVGS